MEGVLEALVTDLFTCTFLMLVGTGSGLSFVFTHSIPMKVKMLVYPALMKNSHLAAWAGSLSIHQDNYINYRSFQTQAHLLLF